MLRNYSWHDVFPIRCICSEFIDSPPYSKLADGFIFAYDLMLNFCLDSAGTLPAKVRQRRLVNFSLVGLTDVLHDIIAEGILNQSIGLSGDLTNKAYLWGFLCECNAMEIIPVVSTSSITKLSKRPNPRIRKLWMLSMWWLERNRRVKKEAQVHNNGNVLQEQQLKELQWKIPVRKEIYKIPIDSLYCRPLSPSRCDGAVFKGVGRLTSPKLMNSLIERESRFIFRDFKAPNISMVAVRRITW